MYATTSTRTMTIRRMGMTPPQPKLKKSGIGRISLGGVDCGSVGAGFGGRGARRAEALDDDAHAGDADDADGGSARDVLVGRRRELLGLSLGPDIDGPEPPLRDGDADRPLVTDEIADRERACPLRAAQRTEEQVGDGEADEAGAAADERGRPTVTGRAASARGLARKSR